MREEAVPEGLLPVVHLPSRPLPLPAHAGGTQASLSQGRRTPGLGQLCPPKQEGVCAGQKKGGAFACLSAGSPLPPHRHSGVLSAYGMALADIVHEAQEPCSLVYEPASFAQLDLRMAALEEACVQALEAQGFARWVPRGEEGAALASRVKDVKPPPARRSHITTEAFLHLRYQRTDCALMCSAKSYPAHAGTCSHGDFGAAFANRSVAKPPTPHP